MCLQKEAGSFLRHALKPAPQKSKDNQLMHVRLKALDTHM